MSKRPVIQLFKIYNINVVDEKNIDDSPDKYPNDKVDHDQTYDEEVNRLLDEVEEELLGDKSDKSENYDCSVAQIYQKMLHNKIKEAKSRLEKLSKLVCTASPSTAAHIKRIEEDHCTTFCKMDYPRHPPMDKPWTNFWKFDCTIKCREIENPNHSHTKDCQTLVLEDAEAAGVPLESSNISQNDYPEHVIHAVKLFQDFATKTTKKQSFSDSKNSLNTIYEKSMWTSIKLTVRSNHSNSLMIVIHGKRISVLIPYLQMYFDSGPGKTPNIFSVLCIDKKRSSKIRRKGIHITGILEIEDKVGPISIKYNLSNYRFRFNSIQIMQLAKIVQDYMGLSKETTLLDIGCNFGVLSIIMAHECEKVIGLNTVQTREAEKLKNAHKMHNVLFVGCNPEDVLSTCSPYIERCITVAVLNLSSPYSKSRHVMRALRDMPSIWRVLIYGSFENEFHENIAVLMSEDDSMGERFLPMQGCILDKSPTRKDAFDIVILFERKSLIAPKIELLAPGPTLNVGLDSDLHDCGSVDQKEVEFESRMDGDQKLVIESKAHKFTDEPTLSSSHSLPVKKDFQFNYPPPPVEELPKPPLFLDPTLPVSQKFQFKYPPPPLFSFPNTPHPSVRDHFHFNFPPPPLGKFHNPPLLPDPYPLIRNDYQNYYYRPAPFQGFPFPPPSHPSLFAGEAYHSNYCLPPPPERLPSPPPPPPPPRQRNDLLEIIPPPRQMNYLLEIACSANSSSKIIEEPEPVKVCVDKKDSESNASDDEISCVFVKSKPATDTSVSASISEANCEDKLVALKSEPGGPINCSADLSDTICEVSSKPEPTDSSQRTDLKDEPEDMEISPNPPDIKSMDTPTRDSKALSDSTPITTVTVEDSEVVLQTDQTFLKSPECDPKLPIDEKEPGEISTTDDEEIEVIAEIKRERRETARKSDSQSSPSPPPYTRYYERPPSPKRRLIRSPSPRKYSRSLSPYFRRYRRSPSPKRSPSPYERRRKRSPISPSRFSPMRRRSERSKRSPSFDRVRRDRRDRSRSRSRSPRQR